MGPSRALSQLCLRLSGACFSPEKGGVSLRRGKGDTVEAMPAMKFSEYLQHDAVALAGCVARGETTAGELLELALGQSARAQPRTNAICRLMENEARSQLEKPLAGPFAGVPFLIKDCAQDYAGLPTTYGSKSMLGIIPREHSHVVRRYLDAGLVIFGKTNLPELALKGVSDSRLFGRASNP